MGLLSLRRRKSLVLDTEIYEVKLGEEFLMSSLFTVAEVALANLGLFASPEFDVDVVVGGLGLGYTAKTVLEHSKVREMLVIDTLAEVIEWHYQGLLPLSSLLTSDPRCRFIHGDFFSMSGSRFQGFDPDTRSRKFHAILLDIDHSPTDLLHPRHASFYEAEGLRKLAFHLKPEGIFALWSNDPPEERFQIALSEVFATQDTHVITFSNPLSQGLKASNTIYVARNM